MTMRLGRFRKFEIRCHCHRSVGGSATWNANAPGSFSFETGRVDGSTYTVVYATGRPLASRDHCAPARATAASDAASFRNDMAWLGQTSHPFLNVGATSMHTAQVRRGDCLPMIGN
ncbi:hypothetical protein [Burkholderia sp. 22PA0106]|uniref:hypothetical protein n=1 Tax=Burkholderia sp. 22PA0106 TaxID=3237371 RepID=UPI0039C076AA